MSLADLILARNPTLASSPPPRPAKPLQKRGIVLTPLGVRTYVASLGRIRDPKRREDLYHDLLLDLVHAIGRGEIEDVEECCALVWHGPEESEAPEEEQSALDVVEIPNTFGAPY